LIIISQNAANYNIKFPNLR